MQRNLLAIETSGSVCSAAVSIEGNLVASVEILRSNVHDEMLSDVVASVCRYAELTVQDIDIVAVSSGPGSFTGLRIGASFAKGLCFSGRAQLLAVPSHVAMMAAGMDVAQLSGCSEILCVIGSHRDLVYLSSTGSEDLDIASQTSLVSIEQAKHRCSSNKQLVVGSGAGLVTEHPISGLSRTSARFVAYAAWKMLAQQSPFTDANAFVPDYHQEFQAR